MNLTPLVVSLIFQATKLAAQAVTGGLRHRAALSELQNFMMKLAEEGRDPTFEEVEAWTARTEQLAEDFRANLAELRSIVSGQGEN